SPTPPEPTKVPPGRCPSTAPRRGSNRRRCWASTIPRCSANGSASAPPRSRRCVLRVSSNSVRSANARRSLMKLYYAPGVCSIGIHVLLEEIGKPYQLELVNLREGGQFKPPF